MISLNLSHNSLIGSIPDEIGPMSGLEALDLSWNELVGEIPQSMTNLNFLSLLNVSYNNLSGQIPMSNQFSTFDSSSYIGNLELYGNPLMEAYSQAGKPNSQYALPHEKKHGSDDEFTEAFKMGTAIGFAYCFCGVCLALFFVDTWRIAYFRFLNNMYDRIYVFAALKKKWIFQKFGNSPK